MKSKLIVAIALVVLVTISFSFTLSSKQSKVKASNETSQNEPIGGFVSESKF